MDTEFLLWSMANSPATIAKLSANEQIDLCEKVFNWQRASETRAIDAAEKQDFKAFEIEVTMQDVLAQINRAIPNKDINKDLLKQIVDLDCTAYVRFKLN